MHWYFCAKCGAPIMKPATVPLSQSHISMAANQCRKCGHLTNISTLSKQTSKVGLAKDNQR
jgi:DNA-directed RNA polymerase subunit RPC12/RpoP